MPGKVSYRKPSKFLTFTLLTLFIILLSSYGRVTFLGTRMVKSNRYVKHKRQFYLKDYFIVSFIAVVRISKY